MTNSSEFDHGTGHKFSVTKNSAGSYRACCGLQVDASNTAVGRTWFSSHPTGFYYPTLKAAKEHMQKHHETGEF
jgi:hypothetical protein